MVENALHVTGGRDAAVDEDLQNSKLHPNAGEINAHGEFGDGGETLGHFGLPAGYDWSTLAEIGCLILSAILWATDIACLIAVWAAILLVIHLIGSCA